MPAETLQHTLIMFRAQLSNRELRPGPAGPTVRTVLVSHELNRLRLLDGQDILEPLSDLLKDILAAAAALTRGPGPQADPVEALAQVDHHAHDFVVFLVLELLSDRGEEDVQPDVVVRLLLLEGVGPAAAVAVLGVLPLGAHALLEEVVVGLWGEVGGGGDVVLDDVRMVRSLGT